MAPVKMKMRRKIAIVLVILLVLLAAVLGKLAYVQFVQGSDLQQKAAELRTRDLSVAANRGTIFDRNGSTLAVSVTADSIAANPTSVKESGTEQDTATFLAETLKLDYADVLSKITADSSFVWIKRKADFEQADAIKEADLKGISIVAETQRFYPQNMLACHVLGFAGIDNEGLEGIEHSRNSDLAGVAGNITGEYDAKNQEVQQGSKTYTPAQDGYDLVLTIDENIQYFCERALENLMAQSDAPKRAAILMMNPQTGEVLAMASRPGYDPNNYQSATNESLRNMLVSDVYEPGSTFKIITAAVALEENVVNLNDRFYDPGYIQVGDAKIKCWRSYNPHGSQDFAEIIQNSCNPGFVTVGLRIEDKEEGLFYKYIKAFGYGSKTNIELSGEASGILIDEEDLLRVNIATISIGQGIAVTPIQMVTAVSAVANGGTLLKPQLVHQVKDQDGNVVQDFAREEVRQVISPETSKTLLGLLERVVSEGTASRAYIEGYRVGGKTGTAQKVSESGGYADGKYVASFVGIAPIDDPQVVCLVILDEPQGNYQGGQVAAPVFKTVMEDTLHYLGVVPEFADKQTARTAAEAKKIEMPDFVNTNANNAVKALKVLGFTPQTEGEGALVESQIPAAFASAEIGGKVVLKLGTGDPTKTRVSVPDLTGLRLSTAMQLLNYLGLSLTPDGSSGTAYDQSPTPGTRVDPGTAVTAKFKEVVDAGAEP